MQPHVQSGHALLQWVARMGLHRAARTLKTASGSAIRSSYKLGIANRHRRSAFAKQSYEMPGLENPGPNAASAAVLVRRVPACCPAAACAVQYESLIFALQFLTSLRVL